MENARYEQLLSNPKMTLTEDEVKEGWHFCLNWDGMLLHPEDREMQCCHCKD